MREANSITPKEGNIWASISRSQPWKGSWRVSETSGRAVPVPRDRPVTQHERIGCERVDKTRDYDRVDAAEA